MPRLLLALPLTALAGCGAGSTPAAPPSNIVEVADAATLVENVAALDKQVVVLNFWATWCGPCRVEIPDLIKVQNKYRDKGLVIVGLSEDDNLKTAAAFARGQGINYPVLIAPREVARELGIEALPTSVLLDRNGRVVWAQAGIHPDRAVEDVLSEQIEKLL